MGKSDSLISFVTDRLGHDFRYAINFEKAQGELGWTPMTEFNEELDGQWIGISRIPIFLFRSLFKVADKEDAD